MMWQWLSLNLIQQR